MIDLYTWTTPNGRKISILLEELGYLAEKYGKFLPTEPARKSEAIEWLMWQMAGFGPMLGQAHHFLHFNPGKAEYAEGRFRDEVARLYGVLNTRLEGREYIVDEYSIVDMACWPWASRYEWQEIDLADYPNVRAWYQRLLAREAVQRGYQVPKDMGDIPPG